MSPNRRNTNTPSHGRRGAAMFASLLFAVGSRFVLSLRAKCKKCAKWYNELVQPMGLFCGDVDGAEALVVIAGWRSRPWTSRS